MSNAHVTVSVSSLTDTDSAKHKRVRNRAPRVFHRVGRRAKLRRARHT